MPKSYEPETVITEIPELTTEYKGRTITVEHHFRPAYEYDYTWTDGTRVTHHEVEAWEIWYSLTNGKQTYNGRSRESADKALKAAKRSIDRQDADEAIYPSLQTYIGRVDILDVDRVSYALDPQVGDRVVGYSRGYYRRGIVAKVGPKNIEIAYVTARNGVMTRKAVARDKVYVEGVMPA